MRVLPTLTALVAAGPLATGCDGGGVRGLRPGGAHADLPLLGQRAAIELHSCSRQTRQRPTGSPSR
jgi:hypothetical protein